MCQADLKKVRPNTSNGHVTKFWILVKMQAKFYAVLVKSCVILRFCTLKGISANFLNFFWQFNGFCSVNEAFFGGDLPGFFQVNISGLNLGRVKYFCCHFPGLVSSVTCKVSPVTCPMSQKIRILSGITRMDIPI